MVEVINKSVCRGVAGRRANAKPNGVVIHNDAGSLNATAKHYVNALGTMTNSQLANGFAHYYIDRNTIARTEDTYNMAWHTANANGNANFVGYEVCQSIGASKADFLANEQMTLKQAALDLKEWGLPANRNTVKLHNQFVATACPHRSQEIHGNGVACQDYFIKEIQNFMSGGAITTNPGTGNQGGNNVTTQKQSPFVKGDKVVISPTARIAMTTPARHFSRAEFMTNWTVESRNGLVLVIKDNNSNGKLSIKDTDVVYMPTNNLGFMDTVRIKSGVTNWRGGKVMTQGAKNGTYSVRQRDLGRNLYIDDGWGNEGWVMDSQVERVK